MPSNFSTFDVTYRDGDGAEVFLASQVVKVHDLDANVSLGTVTTDANGVVEGATLAVDPGTRVSFRVENYNGLAICGVQVTT